MVIKFWTHPRLGFLAGLLGTSLLQSLWLIPPAFSTERIFASYGPIERSISVEALETFALTGEITEELEGYSRYLTPEQLEQLRNGLLVSADLDVLAISQFLYTSQGEAILQWLGEVIQTAGRQNGGRAIRGATIEAAANPEGGLNVLNVLKHFPTQGVRVDLEQLSRLADILITEINHTNQITSQISQQASQAAAESANDNPFASPGALAAAGSYRWEMQPFEQASLPTDLYLPAEQHRPLVVLSHGLGSDRTTLAYLAEHLASHGIAAAVVEHPGSNAAWIGALLGGRVHEAVEPEEMINRPLAIQALLDVLEAAASSDPTLRDRLDFQRVGVLGQSLGAYTTLALAGATVDSNALSASCPPELSQLNPSLLLQCLAPSLPQPLPSLHDSRIKAAIAINPLNSAVFGPEGMANITTPVMIVSGSADTITPALAEQIRPFSWLELPERYLLLMEGGTHFSTIYDPAIEESVPTPEVLIGPDPELAQHYAKAISLAFFKTYLAEDETYRQYLDPSYTAALSQPEIPISIIRELSLEN